MNELLPGFLFVILAIVSVLMPFFVIYIASTLKQMKRTMDEICWYARQRHEAMKTEDP
jgi:uncharacterized protein YoxC